MDVDLVQSFLLCNAEKLINVVKGAVNAAVGGKAHEVEFLAGFLHVLVCSLDFLVFQEFVLTACDIDLDEVLIYYAACAQIHVSHLGVAHLAVRQADVFAACLKMAVGILLAEGVNVGCSLCPYSVGIVVASFAPTIQNHQQYFSVHVMICLKSYKFNHFLQKSEVCVLWLP